MALSSSPMGLVHAQTEDTLMKSLRPVCSVMVHVQHASVLKSARLVQPDTFMVTIFVLIAPTAHMYQVTNAKVATYPTGVYRVMA